MSNSNKKKVVSAPTIEIRTRILSVKSENDGTIVVELPLIDVKASISEHLAALANFINGRAPEKISA